MDSTRLPYKTEMVPDAVRQPPSLLGLRTLAMNARKWSLMFPRPISATKVKQTGWRRLLSAFRLVGSWLKF